MQITLAYYRRSMIVSNPTQGNTRNISIALAPNLTRERVGFGGLLRRPMRFREAICALHDVVISDLRYKPKDKTGGARPHRLRRADQGRSPRPRTTSSRGEPVATASY